MAVQQFDVMVRVRVKAQSKDDANAEVHSLMEHALEVGNDEGLFKNAWVEKNQTIVVESKRKKAAQS